MLVEGTFDTHRTTARTGTTRWTAPELFLTEDLDQGPSLNAGHDVYAFGMTILVSIDQAFLLRAPHYTYNISLISFCLGTHDTT